jgi:hypothetical protein
MRCNFRIGAAVAAVLVLASVAVASAAWSDDNRSSGSDDRKVIVLDLMARVVDGADMDVPPLDPAPDVVLADLTGEDEGDGFVLDIEDSSKGRPVGRESSICTWTHIEAANDKAPAVAATLHCTGVHTYRDGKTTSETSINYGPEDLKRGFKVDPYFSAITGGTGKYRTAHGEVRLQDRSLEDFQAAVKIIL